MGVKALPLFPVLICVGCLIDFDEDLLRDGAAPDSPAQQDLTVDASLDSVVDGDSQTVDDRGEDVRPPDGPQPDKPRPPDGLLPDTQPGSFKSNGSTCSSDGQCLSGHCADGVCCNLPCKGPCWACNLSGKKGVCTVVAEGSSPVSGKSCSTSSKSNCDGDGKCDGAGSCRNWPDGTVCKSAYCDTGDVVKPARHCDGDGACRYAVSSSSSIACAPYACDSSPTNDICHGSCADNSDCASGFTCSGTKCGGKTPLGTSCTLGSQCASGECVEGVCCESACTGVCKTCNLLGLAGRCVNVPDGAAPPAGKSCSQDPPCGEDGTCNGSGACRVTPTGTPCASPTCYDGPTSSMLQQSFCDASTKTCVKSDSSCGNYVCQSYAPSCYGRCKTNSHCRTGSKCVFGLCL
jgi:hypothetical protein